MSELTVIAVYLVPAIFIAVLANRSKVLRRLQGWREFGNAGRPDSVEAAQVAVVASLGTGRDAMTNGQWRVFKSSWGMRLVMPGLCGATIYYMFFEPATAAEMSGLPIVSLLFLLASGYGLLHVYRYNVSTNGHILRIRSAVDRERRFALDQLIGVEEDAVHSFRLKFADGRHVEILKAVEGADELRHILAHRLEQNQRG